MADQKGVEAKSYLTHDNGGSPLLVRVQGQQVTIWNRDETAAKIELSMLLEGKFAEVFIGTSPSCRMTQSSGGAGPKFEGNTILLRFKADALDYAYVQSRVMKFTAKAPIVRYVSPVGNSDVPYPFAVDKDGRVYLMIENAIIEGSPELHKFIDEECDPYEFYYTNGGRAARAAAIELFPFRESTVSAAVPAAPAVPAV